MASDRDRVTPLPSGSTTAGRIAGEVLERDITEQIEIHAGRALSSLLRRVMVSLGWSSAGVALGIGGVYAVQDETGTASAQELPHPEAETKTTPDRDNRIPNSLYLPPADSRLLDSCDRAGEDARRAILDSRMCVDLFSKAVSSCEAAGEVKLDLPIPRKDQ
jgi:hypothetical protein